MYPGLDAIVALVFFKANNPVNQSEQSEIPAQAHIGTGVNLGAQLAHQDISGQYALTAEAFYTASLSLAVAAVSGTAACFFMSHTDAPLSYTLMVLTFNVVSS